MIGAIVAKIAVRKSFETLHRHDLKKFMSSWHDDGIMIYPGDMPHSGVFKGKPAIEAWFRHFFE